MHNLDYLLPVLFWSACLAGFVIGILAGIVSVLQLKEKYDSYKNSNLP